jgi:hypothetical protein
VQSLKLSNYLRIIISIVILFGAAALLGSGEPFFTRFLAIQGREFTLNNQVVQLKGTNYYPKDSPWTFMWRRWHGPAVQDQLELAHSMGINSVRILVPFNPNTGWTHDDGSVDPQYLQRLKEFVQIAGQNQIKVNITLFDFYDTFDPAGTPENARVLSYLRTIVNAFADDDRVFAWDLHNEPDNYSDWREGHPEKVIDWLERMTAEIKTIDQNHPVTVGMAKAGNLWVKGKDGRTVADISDFISFHSYDTNTIRQNITDIKSRTNKPILLQEIGWPTGPDCGQQGYNEDTQSYLYRTMLQAATEGNLAGVMQWSLFDYTGYRSADYDSDADHYGLIKTDGSEKPAAYTFEQLYKVQPLASHSATYYTLSIVAIAPTDSLEWADNFDVYFPETGKTIRTIFKDYWQRNDGEHSLGLPLTEPLHESNLIVQYFQYGRLERNDKIDAKELRNLTLDEQIKHIVRVSKIGSEIATLDKYPRVDAASVAPGRRYFEETGHSLGGAFLSYWEANDGSAKFGAPLSEEVDGPDGAVLQYFERAELEIRPAQDGAPSQVSLGPLGGEYLQQKRPCVEDPLITSTP